MRLEPKPIAMCDSGQTDRPTTVQREAEEYGVEGDEEKLLLKQRSEMDLKVSQRWVEGPTYEEGGRGVSG